MEKDFVGGCPVCGSQMKRIYGRRVICPNNHYSTLESWFDFFWNRYLMTEQKLEDTELLLKDLRDNNLKELYA